MQGGSDMATMDNAPGAERRGQGGKLRANALTLWLVVALGIAYQGLALSIYFNERGRAKVELGLARGKRKADKRQAEKQRDWQRNRARILRERNA